MILQKAELYLDFNICLGSSGVEQSPEKACVGGANPSSATILGDLNVIKLKKISEIK